MCEECVDKALTLTAMHCNVHSDLNDLLKKFWVQEEMVSQLPESPADAECERIFVENLSREKNGRSTVNLPFKPGETPSFEKN